MWEGRDPHILDIPRGIVIREKSHCTILPLDSRNQESAQIPGFWNKNENIKVLRVDHNKTLSCDTEIKVCTQSCKCAVLVKFGMKTKPGTFSSESVITAFCNGKENGQGCSCFLQESIWCKITWRKR
jgi:hypothetical protein